MAPLKILAFAGSTRADSFNRILVRLAAEAARARGAEVTLIELKDFSMPIYNGDLEETEGLPEAAKRLKKLMGEHSAFLIATPEYNGSMTPLLVNALAWVSRSEGANEKSAAIFKGKKIGLLAASPGGHGAQNSLNSLRTLMERVGATVMPEHVSIPRASDAFDTTGKLLDPALFQTLETLVASLLKQ
jgi:chromate reductase, NAD(P)H dehydrogenase (quinone)